MRCFTLPSWKHQRSWKTNLNNKKSEADPNNATTHPVFGPEERPAPRPGASRNDPSGSARGGATAAESAGAPCTGGDKTRIDGGWFLLFFFATEPKMMGTCCFLEKTEVFSLEENVVSWKRFSKQAYETSL